MQKIIIFSAALSLSLFFFGCQDTVNTMENQNHSYIRSNVPTQKFVSDSFCANRLQVINVVQGTTDGGVEKIQFTVRSERYGFWAETWSWIRDANPYHIEYKVEWLDGNGMKVQSPTSVWLPEIFMPGETKYLQAVAPNSKCKDFFVSFKESEHGRL